jgi:glycosyltransferase involved in cell wall biosynthesis
LISGWYDIKVLIRAAPEIKIQYIQQLWLSEYFVFLPETIDDAELAYTYQMMDIMLHTSRIGESFGVSLVEGMYFWLTIVTNSTDFRDYTIFDRDNSQIEIVRDW